MKAIYQGKLAYFEEPATPDFWDRRWQTAMANAASAVRCGLPGHVFAAASRWLPRGSRCLEAGCGMGNVVYGLCQAGWPCVGLDYAEKTVHILQSLGLGLDIHLGDVRAIPFPEGSFDAYISQGVIEHFPEGYGPILGEMDRILKTGGIALISFPSLNPLRKFKRRLRCYPTATPNQSAEFYQFALDPDEVIADVRKMGYTLLELRRYEGVLGIGDEMLSPLNRLVLWLYNKRDSRLCSGVRRVLEPVVSGWAGYCTQITVRKRGSAS
jgi:SAM-dependent methyltransferase